MPERNIMTRPDAVQAVQEVQNLIQTGNTPICFLSQRTYSR